MSADHARRMAGLAHGSPLHCFPPPTSACHTSTTMPAMRHTTMKAISRGGGSLITIAQHRTRGRGARHPQPKLRRCQRPLLADPHLSGQVQTRATKCQCRQAYVSQLQSRHPNSTSQPPNSPMTAYRCHLWALPQGRLSCRFRLARVSEPSPESTSSRASAVNSPCLLVTVAVLDYPGRRSMPRVPSAVNPACKCPSLFPSFNPGCRRRILRPPERRHSHIPSGFATVGLGGCRKR